MGRLNQHKFTTFDGIRGLAALLIVIRHTGNYFGELSFDKSYLAVDLFFILSGFVIAEAYSNKLANNLSVVAFFKLRVIRLYPLYLVGALLGIIVCLVGIKMGHTYLIQNFTFNSVLAMVMLPSPLTSSLFSYNGPSWTLFFELLANLVYALSYKRLNNNYLLIVILASAIILGSVSYEVGTFDGGFLWKDFYIGTARVLFSFNMGVFLQKNKINLLDLKVPSWIIIVIVTLLLSYNPSPELSGIYDFVVVVFLFPVLINAASNVESNCKFLVSTYLFLGAISYAIYIVHTPVAWLIRGGLLILNINVADYAPISGLILIICLIAISWLLICFYEKPFRRELTSKFIKRSNKI